MYKNHAAHYINLTGNGAGKWSMTNMAKIEWFYLIITTLVDDDSEVLTSDLFRTYDFALQQLKDNITDNTDVYGEYTEEQIENHNEEEMKEIYAKTNERIQIRQIKVKSF